MPLAPSVGLLVLGAIAVLGVAGYLIDKSAGRE